MARNMSDTEIRHRKKVQGQISRTTSTLGLSGLGMLGASVAAKKNPAVLKPLRKIPKLKKVSDSHLRETAQNVGLVSGGIGGVGGYNFAAYTNAESRKKSQMVKKAWSATGTLYDSEKNRAKRADAYQTGANVAAGGAAVGSVHQLHQGAKNWRGMEAARGITRKKKLLLSRKATGRGVLLAATAAGSAGAAQAVKHKKNASWQPYAKRSALSAFGVEHD